MNFCDRLKNLRKEKKINRKNLAEILEIDSSTYGKYELGLREPKYEMLIKLSDYFDVSTDYLLGRTDILNTTGINKGKSDLPPEAIKDLENYKEYLKQKYKGK